MTINTPIIKTEIDTNVYKSPLNELASGSNEATTKNIPENKNILDKAFIIGLGAWR